MEAANIIQYDRERKQGKACLLFLLTGDKFRVSRFTHCRYSFGIDPYRGDAASARSPFLTSPVMIVGVRKMTISVFVRFIALAAEGSALHHGISPKNGTFL